MRNRKPTIRQMRVMFSIWWLSSTIKIRGYSPSYRELSKYLGITFKGTWDHVNAIIRKGLMKKDDGVLRSISITPEGIEAMKEYGFRPRTGEVYKREELHDRG